MYISRICTAMAALLTVMTMSYPATAQNVACDSKKTFGNVASFLQKRKYDEAARALDDLRQCPKLSPLENFQMGWLYGRARHFDTALKIFRSVPDNVPDRLTHQYAVALSKFELADYQGTVNVLKSLPSGIADANAANLLAVSYSKLGLYRDAYAILTQEIEKNPHDLSARLNLVTVSAESGSFEQAAQVAAAAARVFPQSAEIFVAEGAANSLLGHFDQAYVDFSTAAHLDPNRTDVRFFLALMDYKQGKFSDAIAVLQAANHEGLVDSDLHYLLAECLLKLNAADRASAITELNRAIELDGNSVSARVLRGRLMLETGHPKEAAADLEFANRRDPESRSALYNLARAYRALGKTEQARVLFEQLRGQTTDTLTALSDQKLNDALTGKGSQP